MFDYIDKRLGNPLGIAQIKIGCSREVRSHAGRSKSFGFVDLLAFG
ncbi:hypothetical protein [Salinibacter ruber]